MESANGWLVVYYEDPKQSNKECYNFFETEWVCHYDDIRAVSHEARIANIEFDGYAHIADCQTDAPWHLGSISNTNEVYSYDAPQPETLVYVLDTWIDVDHPDFESRASVGKAFSTGSKHPHGTHVAGLIAGKQSGINKAAKIVSVQVMDDSGYGPWSTLIAALQWVSKKPPSIINLSLVGPASTALDSAIRLMIKRGWKIVVAAGNDKTNACNYSPSRIDSAITVGAVSKQLKLASFSNWGPCVDLLAPGEAILSSYPGSQYAYMSGTSMAAPIVAGVLSVRTDWKRNDLISMSRKITPPGHDHTTNRVAFLPTTNMCFIRSEL